MSRTLAQASRMLISDASATRLESGMFRGRLSSGDASIACILALVCAAI
jgi:hypothetical protein